MNSEIGFDRLIWFMGIVENENDPARQGRVQVRCFGIHPSAETGEVLTEDLPWAPVTNAGHGGTVLPTKGDWVWGAFMDGRDAQHPFVVGVIPGINAQLPTDSGSSDPYTKASREAFANYGLPPMPKVQSGEDLETTQLPLQNAALLELQDASKADGTSQGYPILEPAVPFATQPHKNAVWKSRNSSSYIQVSEGEENILLSHESGSHIQIDSEGNIKIKSFGDSYILSEGHTYEGGRGAKSISIEGPYSLKCKNATIEVEGDMNHTVNGDYNLNVGGKFAISTGQSFEIAAQRIAMEATTEHINLKSAQKTKITSGAELSMKAGGNMYQQTSGAMHIIGSSSINADADEIYLNSGASESVSSQNEAVSPKVAKPVMQTLSAKVSPRLSTPGTIGAGAIDDQEE